MCGRYTITSPEQLLGQLGLAGALGAWRATYNAAPGRELPCVLNLSVEQPGRACLVRWGLIPRWSKEPKSKWINARSESLADRAAFREAYAERRCLVPADGFYEWRREGNSKTPFYFRRSDGLPVAFAGLWERFRLPDGSSLRSFAIATTQASEPVAAVHDRMPVIVAPEDYQRWLSPEPLEPAALDDIACHSRCETLEGFEVSKRVNSVANDGPELIDREDGPRQLGLF